MCDAIEHDGTLTRARRIGGGLSAATDAVDIRTSRGEVRRLVLKRYRAGDTAIDREWHGLHFASAIDVPSPRPVALDADGSWFGTAALVMTRLPGRSEVNGIHGDRWLTQIAASLARIHTTAPPLELQLTIGFRPVDMWASPSKPSRNVMLRRAHQLIERLPAIETEPRLIHGDFFSGNLIWSRARLTGVVDWRSIGRGPRQWDLVIARTDLVILSGWRAADRLLRLYEAETNRAVDCLAPWDLYCGLIGIENFRHWLAAYHEQGLKGVSPRLARSRLLVFVGRALAMVNVCDAGVSSQNP